ncbi:Protein PIN-LIKES 3 [Hondaea fermentalgiana]|uniref:Protein PIN-LIKES 3 n=1 Tax=Hondaea fermentalgiana TaxID=2315210 RepID=A0A2R5G2Z1_9STRA|nr:Protein PIN-LIKES 3 [Hondaea fermentalgiana]|eukprot:GBG25397.1 Protein PIN-LIKES 3 [Hondaea fermentalgiana]
MASVADLLWTSVKAIAPVFVVLASGAWLVRQGLLDERASGTLSWLAKWVYAPALLFVRLGGSVNRDLFAEVWVLTVMGVVILSLNLLMGILLLPIAKPAPQFRKWFVYSMTFPNIMSLPLVFTTAVCASGTIRKPLSMDQSGGEYLSPTECTERGELYLFIYILAIIVALIPPLQSFLFSDNSVATPFISVLRIFAPGLVSVITLALATLIGTKLVKTRYADLFGGDEATMGISRRTLLLFVLGRTVIIPGVLFFLMYLALDLFPKDQLLLVILFFECFVPTANMCALCAPPAQGQIISLGMVNQYLVGIFTMTMWCFVALSLSTTAIDA